MTFTEKMTEKARSMGKTLVLPEGNEPRTIQAARIIVDERIASAVTLLGKKEAIQNAAADSGTSLEGIQIVDPSISEKIDAYAQEYYELRKHKGLSLEDAKAKIITPLLWGAMMVRLDDADAIVAGAENATAKVLLAGFTIIKPAPGVKSASSCFVMDFPEKSWGEDGMMVFSDCGTIIDPNTEQLAEITAAAAQSCRLFLDAEPKVAMLSFSTKGSASHPMIDKVTDAMKLVKEAHPELLIDGELQMDAAIVPSVAAQKAPGSPVAGQANTLIFPNLEAGNIAYKTAQRFGNAGAYGPILQGFAKPISDLSRGASVQDIVNVCAITLIQAK
ncbi:MAG: phosphate acetyltransferase [Spirochaetales bacterium]|nr:phosphate acetyltransferase [Spirochaetales bacterium]